MIEINDELLIIINNWKEEFQLYLNKIETF